MRFVAADASVLPFPNDSFGLVAHANMIPFFDELVRVLEPGGQVLFAFSLGVETPIYVPAERLRAELERRGFMDFAEFAAGDGHSVSCPQGSTGVSSGVQGRSRRGITGPDGLLFAGEPG